MIKSILDAGITLSGLSAATLLGGCATTTKMDKRKPSSVGNYKFTALKSDRIAIIGAGAAGISAAHFLRERGFKNIVVFEELPRMGGKCCSVKIDDLVYDMGAVFTTSSYTEVISLAERFQVSLGNLQGDDPAVILDKTSPNFYSSSLIDRAALLGVASEYLLKINSNIYPFAFEPGFGNLDRRLMVPFSEWLDKNSISPKTLDSFFGYTFTPFGYGYANQVPAAYAIKYYESKLVTSLIQQSSHLRMVKDGYQTLWEKVAAGMEVRLNSGVEKVVRNEREKTIQIFTKGSGTAEVFDWMILTCPLDQSLKFLDSTPTERDIFSRIKNYYYYSFEIETPENFPSTGFLPINYSQERQEHPLCWLKRWKNKNISIFYVLSDTPNNFESILKNTYVDLAQKKFKLRKIRDAKCWKYFPHFNTADLQNKIYDNLESLQGDKNTLYAGEIMNFSTVELTTRFSKHLVERYF